MFSRRKYLNSDLEEFSMQNMLDRKTRKDLNIHFLEEEIQLTKNIQMLKVISIEGNEK